MANCEYQATGLESAAGTQYACAVCGHRRTSRHPAAQLHRRCPQAGPTLRELAAAPRRRPWGLGDVVHRIARFFGFRACGRCRRRRRWLNELSRRFRAFAARCWKWLTGETWNAE